MLNNSEPPSVEPLSSRQQWLAERRKGIGGSDAAAICGFDPFKGAMAVWLDKTGKLPPDEEERDVLVWGHHLEDDVITEFERQNGEGRHDPPLVVSGRQTTVVHSEKSFMRATLDGYVYDARSIAHALAIGGPPVMLGIFEGKTASGRSWDWGKRGLWLQDIPMHVIIQVQHNMACAGADKCFVAVLITAPVIDFRWWEVPRDEETIQNLYEIEEAFWNNHVLANVPPPADGSYGTLEAVKRAYASAEKGKRVDLDPYGFDLLRRRQRAWSSERDARNLRSSIDAELIQILGDAEEGYYNGVKMVTRKTSVRHDVDVETLKRDYPEIADKVMREATIRTLRVLGKEFPIE